VVLSYQKQQPPQPPKPKPGNPKPKRWKAEVAEAKSEMMESKASMEVPLTRGDSIQYIYTNAAHSNPLRIVTPVEFIEEGREQVYDKEKYREMLLDAEIILGYFRFRTLYGHTGRRKGDIFLKKL